MVRFLVFGFELQLYKDYELTMIYWYLENLFEWKAQLYLFVQWNSLAEAHSSHRFAHVFQGSLDCAGGHVGNERSVMYGLVQAKQALCSGMRHVTALWLKEQRVKRPAYFDSERLRYHNRFKAFLAVNLPSFLAYDAFRASQQKLSEECTYGTSVKCFTSCKVFLEGLINKERPPPDTSNELKSLLKISKTNIVVLNLLASGYKATQRVQFDFSLHPEFPTFRVRLSKYCTPPRKSDIHKLLLGYVWAPSCAQSRLSGLLSTYGASPTAEDRRVVRKAKKTVNRYQSCHSAKTKREIKIKKALRKISTYPDYLINKVTISALGSRIGRATVGARNLRPVLKPRC
ncbi:N-alpha-acetyltransferase 35, NatC auxiliary subunit-like [Zophobas morio]|uniref:N-alpha-acetyltransferase 35, NatC auxiliary subunit-like n=1 Tax=Zophobas morio TaxID=2755281 RepID=UPI0030832922